MHNEHPELIRDQYWDDILLQELPHTVASQCFRTSPHMGSTAHLEMSAFGDADIFPSGQLPNLNEENKEESTDDILDNCGESRYSLIFKNWLATFFVLTNELLHSLHRAPVREKSSRKKFQRQVSEQSEIMAPNSFINNQSRLRTSRKWSVFSVFQKLFNMDNSTISLSTFICLLA